MIDIAPDIQDPEEIRPKHQLISEMTEEEFREYMESVPF